MRCADRLSAAFDEPVYLALVGLKQPDPSLSSLYRAVSRRYVVVLFSLS